MNDKYISEINNLFEAGFKSAYKNIKVRGKSKLLALVAHFHRQWYYSALVEDTILSPANLAYKLGSGISAISSVRLNKSGSRYNITFAPLSYSLESHPVVEDFRIFLSYIQPNVSLDENDFLVREVESEILSRVSIFDPFYVEYLLLLAIHLDLIKKMPAIYSNRAQATNECEAFLKLSDKEILVCIIEETIDISTMFIQGLSPFWASALDREFIVSLLKNPVSTDEIFNRVYSAMGLDINSIMHYDFDEFELDSDFLSGVNLGQTLEPDFTVNMKQAFMASSLLLGSLLDKYFFTFFGYYLKLIQPLYVLPFSFEKTMDFAHRQDKDDIPPALYSPCSTYALTALGGEYFSVSFLDNDMQISDDVPGHLLAEVVLSQLSGKELAPEIISEINRHYCGRHKAIYQIKARLGQNRLYWKIIEVSSLTTLHKLHLFICDAFNLAPMSNYSFYTDENMNPFTRYTPAYTKGRHKKTNEITLDDLALPTGCRFVYVDQNSPGGSHNSPLKSSEIKLILEISKVKKPSGVEYYPRISKVSKAYKNLAE